MVAPQVEAMVAQFRVDNLERRQHLERALGILTDQAADPDELEKKIAASLGKTTFLVARPVEGLDGRFPAPAAPAEFSVAASDGSQVDVDRHQSNRCCLVNTGGIVLDYGPHPDAILNSLPRLYWSNEDLTIRPATGGGERLIEGTLLAVKRDVEECRHLADLVAGLPPSRPALALLDGSLIKWTLAGKEYPEFVVEELLDKGFLACLSRIKQLNRERLLPVASYISFPGSTDVVNALRLAICPYDPADCDKCKETPSSQRDCDAVAGIRDRDLFAPMLADGERSVLFGSQSKVLMRYGPHQVHFFYLRVDDEIARVEIPEWVARDKERLELTHSLILDQCRRGHGYPLALAEAHEQAVITGADRDNFRRLVELTLVEEHLPQTTSAKSRNKRTRWV
jgi:hypothetical protein